MQHAGSRLRAETDVAGTFFTAMCRDGVSPFVSTVLPIYTMCTKEMDNEFQNGAQMEL